MIQRNSLLVLLLCGLVGTACTPAVRPDQPTQAAAPATAPETAAEPESQSADASQKMVCKTIIPTGTRFRQRVCATQADWDRAQQASRDAGNQAQRKGVQTGNPSEPTGN